jgi:hypothetical protein
MKWSGTFPGKEIEIAGIRDLGSLVRNLDSFA